MPPSAVRPTGNQEARMVRNRSRFHNGGVQRRDRCELETLAWLMKGLIV